MTKRTYERELLIEKACDLEIIVKDKRIDWRSSPSAVYEKTKKIQKRLISELVRYDKY